MALLLTSAATLAAAILQHWLPAHGLSLVFLPSVLLAAIGFGLLTGLATAAASFLAFNFFFIPPTFTFRISDPQDMLALLIFFATALLTGSLAGRMREVADAAQHRATALLGLNDLAARLSAATNEQAVFEALVEAASLTEGAAIVLTTTGESLTLATAKPSEQQLTSADWQSAEACRRSRRVVFGSAPGWPGAGYEFHPLVLNGQVLAVLGITSKPHPNSLGRETVAAVETMLQHAGIAITRTRLAAETASARTEAERERLRSTLLSSLSHDLRTPLASILGSVTSLRELGSRMDEETRADLLAAIEEETGRLSQFVANLLDMTRLEGGSPDIMRDWVDVGDCLATAVARARRLLVGREIRLSVESDLPLVRADATLLEHVAFNLIDNAAKYSEAGQLVKVVVERCGDGDIAMVVEDDGPGIAPELLSRVFDKHFRAPGADRRVPGTGLGLTICRRVIDAFGGTIVAESPISRGRGTRVTCRLPVPVDGPRLSEGAQWSSENAT